MRTIKIARRVVDKDGEGVPIITYNTPTSFQAEVWAANTSLQAQTYGDRINAIMNAKIKGAYEIVIIDGQEAYQFKDAFIREGDGVYINRTDKPDYRIISIKPYKPLRLELEKI